MNGAPLFSLEISERKAYTSGLVEVRTADLLALVQPGQSLYALSTVGGGRFCQWPTCAQQEHARDEARAVL